MFIQLKIHVFSIFAQPIAFGIASYFERHQEFHSRFKTNGEISSTINLTLRLWKINATWSKGSVPLRKSETGLRFEAGQCANDKGCFQPFFFRTLPNLKRFADFNQTSYQKVRVNKYKTLFVMHFDDKVTIKQLAPQ